MNEQRSGFYGGLFGVVVGGFAWLVISGFVIHEAVVWAPPLVLGLGLWQGAARAYARRPERQFTILGVVMLAVIIVCALYLEPVVSRIPERLGGITTGKSAVPLIQLKMTLALLGALGVGFVGRDLFKEV